MAGQGCPGLVSLLGVGMSPTEKFTAKCKQEGVLREESVENFEKLLSEFVVELSSNLSRYGWFEAASLLLRIGLRKSGA
ncbi:MAG: hypothetical protein QW570_08625 [Candidatus Caldarchaeum sp.]